MGRGYEYFLWERTLNCVKWSECTRRLLLSRRNMAALWPRDGTHQQFRTSAALFITHRTGWGRRRIGRQGDKFWYFGLGFNFLSSHILLKVPYPSPLHFLNPRLLLLPLPPPPRLLSPTCYPSHRLTLICFMEQYELFITARWGPGHCRAAHFIGLAVVPLILLFIPADRPASIRHFSPDSVRHATSCSLELLPK